MRKGTPKPVASDQFPYVQFHDFICYLQAWKYRDTSAMPLSILWGSSAFELVHKHAARLLILQRNQIC